MPLGSFPEFHLLKGHVCLEYLERADQRHACWAPSPRYMHSWLHGISMQSSALENEGCGTGTHRVEPV